jgi:hypothetical protein
METLRLIAFGLDFVPAFVGETLAVDVGAGATPWA